MCLMVQFTGVLDIGVTNFFLNGYRHTTQKELVAVIVNVAGEDSL